MIEPMLKDRIYRSTKLRAAIDVAKRHGIAPETTLQGTGIAPDWLTNSENLISIHDLLIALGNLERTRVSSTLPYEIGQSIHVSAYGMYGFAILCSNDFRYTMAFAQKYHILAAPFATITFEDAPGEEGWTIRPIRHPIMDDELRAFLTNMQIGVHISLHRDIMGPQFTPRLITVDYAPSCFYQLPKLPGVDIITGAGRTHMYIDDTWLDTTPTFGNDVTFDQIETLCRTELSEISSKAGVSGRVRTLLMRNLSQPPSLEEIAGRMNVSSRTLRRRLAAESTSYREILDETRSELAIRLITNSEMTNDEAAYALGFADVSSFRRAFSRWTGRTTSDFRSDRVE